LQAKVTTQIPQVITSGTLAEWMNQDDIGPWIAGDEEKFWSMWNFLYLCLNNQNICNIIQIVNLFQFFLDTCH
jgi:hypothetical protein